jgi:outer membrane protein
VGCLLVLAAGIVRADGDAGGDCREISAQCVAVGRWNFSVGMGAGARSNPLVDGRIIPLVVVPQVSYYGKRFFLDDLDLGFTLVEGRSNTLSLIASPGYDRVFFYRYDLQNFFVEPLTAAAPAGVGGETQAPAAVRFPARARRITYLAGPEWTFEAGLVTGQLDVLHDITDQSNGTELRSALGIPLWRARGTLTANLGVTWKSSNIVNYYYGAPNIYHTGAAWDPFLKLGYRRPLAGKWSFNAFVDYEKLGAAIADSPIIAHRYVATGFAGAVYSF